MNNNRRLFGFIRLALVEAWGNTTLPGLMLVFATIAVLLAAGLHRSPLDPAALQFFHYFLPAVSTRDIDPVRWLLVIIYQQTAAWTVIVGTIATSGMLVSYLRRGTIEIFLAKPIDRRPQWFIRSGCSLLLIGIPVSIFIASIWLVFGLRTGVWSAGFLAASGLVPFMFMTCTCLSVLVAGATQNIVLSVAATYLFTFVSTALEHRQEGLFQLWQNSSFHSLLDVLYYMFPQLDRMLDNASILIARAPGETIQSFTWRPFIWSFLAAAAWYGISAWVVLRREE